MKLKLEDQMVTAIPRLEGLLKPVEDNMDYAVTTNGRIAYCVTQLDGYCSDDTEKTMLTKIAGQTKHFNEKATANQGKVADINSKLEDFRASQELRRFALIQDIIGELDEKVQLENSGLRSQMNTVIKTAVQKSLKKNEQLVDIILTTQERIDWANDQIKVVEARDPFLQERARPLFDCLFKRKIEDYYLPQNSEYQESLGRHLIELYDLLERAQMHRRKFDREIPALVKQQRSRPVALTETAL